MVLGGGRLLAVRLLAGLLLAALLLAAPAAVAAPQESPWRAMPWHLMDWFHALPDGQPFRTVAIEMDVVQAPQEGDHIFLAVLAGQIGSQSFYVGLQTDLHDGRRRVNRGPGLIFSRWGGIAEAGARPPPEGWAVVPNPNTADEGDFISVRRAMEWGAGRYLFQLQARPLSPSQGRAEAGMWVDLLVFDVQRQAWIDGGGLHFDAPVATFRPRPVSFVEVYRLPPGGGPHTLPPMDIVLRGPLLNGTLRPLGGRPHIPADVPPVARAEPTATDHTVRIVVRPAALERPDAAPTGRQPAH